MKKTIITLALVAAASVSSFGQGWVAFANAGNTSVSTNSVVGGAATGKTFAYDPNNAVATGYYFALFASVAQTSINSSTAAISGTNANYAFNASGWTFQTTGFGPDYGTNGTAGRFSSTAQDPANSQGTGVASGSAQQFVVIGWSANIGSTVSALTTWYNNGNPLTTGWIGQSAISGPITPGSGGLALVASIFGTTTGTIPGFVLGEAVPTLAPTPEPATLALAGLSGASLLLFRRRK